MTDFIREKINDSYKFISEKEENISIEYISTLWNRDEAQIPDISARFAAVLQENIGNDIKRETTLKGPHRDDLNFLKDGLLLKQFGSQGENKTFLIALKFIESAYLKMELNEAPLLLLDDIFGELDEYRINHLMDYVLGIGQSFITTTLKSKFLSSSLTGSNFIEVVNGKTVS